MSLQYLIYFGMSEWLTVHDWKDWQSYRSDRGQPPWIKVHRRVVRSPKWLSLTDAERGQLLTIWILAAENDGKVPSNASILARMGAFDSEPELHRFVMLGFLDQDSTYPALASTRRQHDANTTPTRRQHDAPEAEAENPLGFSASTDRAPYGPDGPAARDADPKLTWAEIAALVRDGYINDYPPGTRYSEIDRDHLKEPTLP